VQANEHTFTPENTRIVTRSPSTSPTGMPFSIGSLTIRYSSLTQPISVEKYWTGLMRR
jgi:hypothetical protein